MTTQNKLAPIGTSSLGTLADAIRQPAQTGTLTSPPPLPPRPVTAAQSDSDEVTVLRAEMARIQAENEALRAKKTKSSTMSFKVAEKSGAISIYGLGRYPVTLYKTQMDRLFTPEAKADYQAFIEENKGNPNMKLEKPSDFVAQTPKAAEQAPAA